ncbi:MAG: phage tail tape measure protein [Rhodobacterales bacterium]|nr:phage tail tape measure protein [Rhodobacterales bacterium]
MDADHPAWGGKVARRNTAAEALANLDLAGGIAAASAEARLLADSMGIALRDAMGITGELARQRAANSDTPRFTFGLPSVPDPMPFGSPEPLTFGDLSSPPPPARRTGPVFSLPPRETAGSGGGTRPGDTLAELQAEAQAVFSTLATAQAIIAEKVRAGLLTAAEGTEALTEVKETAATDLAGLVGQIEAMAAAAGQKAPAALETLRDRLDQLMGDIPRTSDALRQVADTLTDGFTDFFADLISGAGEGASAIENFGNAVIQTFARIAAERFTAAWITPLVDSLFSGLGSILPFAQGGVPDAPGLAAHADTVVDRPTPFLTRPGDPAVMGEAGPEAILPLRRDGAGNIGVLATGPDGSARVVPLRRTSQGALGVVLPGERAVATRPGQGSPRAFAQGGVPDAPAAERAPMAATAAGFGFDTAELFRSLREAVSGATAALRDGDAPRGAAGSQAGVAAGFTLPLLRDTAPVAPWRSPVAEGPGIPLMPAAAATGRATGDRMEGDAGSAGIAPQTIVNIENRAQGVEMRSSERQTGSTRIVDIIVEQAVAAFAGSIRRGVGPASDALADTYGLIRQGR